MKAQVLCFISNYKLRIPRNYFISLPEVMLIRAFWNAIVIGLLLTIFSFVFRILHRVTRHSNKTNIIINNRGFGFNIDFNLFLIRSLSNISTLYIMQQYMGLYIFSIKIRYTCWIWKELLICVFLNIEECENTNKKRRKRITYWYQFSMGFVVPVQHN